jgi:hypothetical protein
MGVLADFFSADPDTALRYAHRLDDSDEGEEIVRLLHPAHYKNITGLEIGLLWAILEDREWDASKHLPEDIDLGEDGEAWLHRFPDELAQLLAYADQDGLTRAALRWAETEELDCDPAELRPLLDDLQQLARNAAAGGKSVYLWGCL